MSFAFFFLYSFGCADQTNFSLKFKWNFNWNSIAFVSWEKINIAHNGILLYMNILLAYYGLTKNDHPNHEETFVIIDQI